VECGGNFTVILDSDGRLYSFGDNRYGQLGIIGLDGIVLDFPAGIQLYMKKAIDFSCGEEHAAYVNDQGEVFTWGYGRDG
jgi:alpha-tubulin suppressor-like RCC1 family protein